MDVWAVLQLCFPPGAPVCGCHAPAKGAVCVCQQEWDLQAEVLDKFLFFSSQQSPSSCCYGVLWEYGPENLADVVFGGEVESKFYGQSLVGCFRRSPDCVSLMYFFIYFPLELQLIALFAKPGVAPACIRPTAIPYH